MEVSYQITLCPLYPRGNIPGMYWIGAWVGPRAGLVYVTVFGDYLFKSSAAW